MADALNVTETPVIPDAPSTVANEQLYIYIPIATEDDYGSVKIGEDLLVDGNGRLQVFFNPDKVVTLTDEQQITGKKIFDDVSIKNFASDNSVIGDLVVQTFKTDSANISTLSISTAPKNDNDAVRLQELRDAAVKGIVLPFNLEKGAGLDSIVQKVSLTGEPDEENFVNTATGVGAVTLGKSNTNSGARSLVDGMLNVNTAANSALIGFKNINNGVDSFLAGTGNVNKAVNALLSGADNVNEVSGSGSLLSGYNLYNNRANAALFGYNNLYNPDNILTIGNGASDAKRRNAFAVLRDGRAKVQSTPIENDDVVRLLELNALKDQINAVNGIKYKEVVSKLPTVGDEYTLYFLTRSDGSYDEYLYIDGAWELIGGGNNANLDNVVTTDTTQYISGEKTFENATSFQGDTYSYGATNLNGNVYRYDYLVNFPDPNPENGQYDLAGKQDIPTNYVTTDSEQEITGDKYFRGTFCIKEWEGEDSCEIQEDGMFMITVGDYYNAFMFPLNSEKTVRVLATTEEVPVIVRW